MAGESMEGTLLSYSLLLRSMVEDEAESERKWSRSVVFNSLQPHGLWPTGLLCPWDSPGTNTGVDCNAGDLDSIPGLGRSPGERRDWQPIQYSCLENSMDRGTWWATVHGVSESDTTEWLTLPLLVLLGTAGLSDLHFRFMVFLLYFLSSSSSSVL